MYTSSIIAGVETLKWGPTVHWVDDGSFYGGGGLGFRSSTGFRPLHLWNFILSCTLKKYQLGYRSKLSFIFYDINRNKMILYNYLCISNLHTVFQLLFLFGHKHQLWNYSFYIYLKLKIDHWLFFTVIKIMHNEKKIWKTSENV